MFLNVQKNRGEFAGDKIIAYICGVGAGFRTTIFRALW
jgi:hypothetical protein